MKKAFSIILAILFVFSLFPLSVFADGENLSEHDRLIEAATKAFPEYASKLVTSDNAPCGVISRSTIPVQIITSETRKIDDCTLLTYQENSDGNAYIIEATSSSPFTPIYYVTDSATGTGYSRKTITIRVTATFTSQVFVASNVTFTFIQDGGVSVSSLGTFDASTTRNNYVRSHSPINQVLTFARIRYDCTFDHIDNGISSRIDLDIYGTTFTIDAYTTYQDM